jgi:hypothetical protein
MARFGEQVVQGLINPSFGQGLFEAGTAIGSAPRRAREEEEKKRKEKGLLGGLMQIQQAAQAGQLDAETARMAAGSLQGLGMPVESIMSALSNAQGIQQQVMEKQRVQKERSSLGEAFVSAADQAGFDENIIKDVVRAISSGAVTDLNSAITRAQEGTEAAATREYYSNISEYSPQIGALVARGNFEAADAVFSRLQNQETLEEAAQTMQTLADNGGILTGGINGNRGSVWKAVSAQSKDLNEATTTMNRLEEVSLRNRTNSHKGPTKTITYVAQPKSLEEGMAGLFSSGTTKAETIEAPVDSATGEINAQWLADFKKHVAKQIIGMGEEGKGEVDSQISVETDDVEKTPLGKVTPLDLYNSFSSTAG